MENNQLSPDLKRCEKCGGLYEDWPGGGCDCEEEEREIDIQAAKQDALVDRAKDGEL